MTDASATCDAEAAFVRTFLIERRTLAQESGWPGVDPGSIEPRDRDELMNEQTRRVSEMVTARDWQALVSFLQPLSGPTAVRLLRLAEELLRA